MAASFQAPARRGLDATLRQGLALNVGDPATEQLAEALTSPAAAPPDRADDAELTIRDAGVAAIRRLEERTGASSLDRIGAVRQALTRSDP